MINKEVLINKKTRAVINGENGDLFRLGVDGENLQENIVFKFDDEFVDGTARIEITMQDNTKSYIMITKVDETYVMPVKSILTKTGLNKMQLVITQGTDDEEIPIFKSKMFSFFIAESINADTEQPEGYPQWIDKANTKLNEIDNFDIDAIKELNEATITITDRYGVEKSVQIFDGAKGDDGKDGKDAVINGVNTLRMVAGNNISIEQDDDVLTINAEGSASNSYNNLSNKPKINNVELSGNKSLDDLNIQEKGDYALSSDIPDVSNFINKDVDDLTNYYKKTETYTQTEINNKLSAVYKYRGSVATYQDLPASDLTIGDVYNVEDTGDNYAWTGTAWDKLSGVVDLSGYQTLIDSSHKLSSDLVDDTNNTNLFVNSTEKATWNGKSDFSGSYNDLTNKPELSDFGELINVYNSNNAFVFSGKKKGIYVIGKRTTATDGFYYKKDNNSNAELINDITPFFITIITPLDEIGTPSENTYFANLICVSAVASRNGRYEALRFYINNQGNIQYDTETPNIFGITSKQQTFWGQKIFSMIPKQDGTTAPTNNAEFTNKKYVDDQVKTKITQYSTMPTASSTYLDKIVQFIGTTDVNYTNGYFYKCVSDGQDPATYNWEQTNIQPAPSMSAYEEIINKVSSIDSSSTNTQYASAKAVWDLLSGVSSISLQRTPYPATQNSQFDFRGKKAGIYVFNFYADLGTDYYPFWFYITPSSNGRIYTMPLFLIILKDLPDTIDITQFEANETFAVSFELYNDQLQWRHFRRYGSNESLEQKVVFLGQTLLTTTNSSQIIRGTKKFYAIPEYNNANTTPTSNGQLTSKKYVDDQITAQIGNINTILATLTTPSNN